MSYQNFLKRVEVCQTTLKIRFDQSALIQNGSEYSMFEIENDHMDQI